ncbi:MAG: hypothetical protein Q9219_002219 [cf. Caloplaca sp. 3 TL-2023]
MGTRVCCSLFDLQVNSVDVEDRLKRDLGQTLTIVLDGKEDPLTIRSLITEHGIGSVVVSCSEAPGPKIPIPNVHLDQRLQQFARDGGQEYPLLIGLKEEGSLYDILPFGLGAAQFPYPLTLAAGNSPTVTSQIGQTIGKNLTSIGVNWIFTPSLDLLTAFIEPLDASQTFGSNHVTVSDHAIALIQGLATEGVSACTNVHPTGPILEIFSSHGGTAELRGDIYAQSETPEFAAATSIIASYPQNSMQYGAALHDFPNPEQSAHVIRTACDLILRDKCRFQGPTVSSFAAAPDDAFVCAKHEPLITFLSGLDMVKIPEDATYQEAAISVLKAAMNTNTLPPAMVQAAAARVVAFKSTFLTWDKALKPRRPELLLVPASGSLTQNAYRASVTAVSNDPTPLRGLPRTSILVLLTPTVPRRNPNSPSDPFEPLGRALSRSFPRLRHVPYTLSAGLTDVHQPFLQRATAVVFVLCNTSSAMNESQDEMVKTLQDTLRAIDAAAVQQRTQKVVIGAGDPRDLRDPFTGWWSVLCYEYSRGALEAVAEVLLGEREATGRLPV